MPSIVIKVTREEFKDIYHGKNEFIEAEIGSITLNDDVSELTVPVVGVSVNRRKGTILVQVGKAQ